MISPYKKLLAALVGITVLLVNRHFGFDLSPHEAVLVDIAIGALTAAGVYGFANEETA